MLNRRCSRFDLVASYFVLLALTAIIVLFPRAAEAATVDSGTCGGCEWVVDGQGCLTIRPQNGKEYASFRKPAISDETIEGIVSIQFEGECLFEDPSLPSQLGGLFRGYPNLVTADLSGLSISEQTSSWGTWGMFSDCPKLISVDFSGCDLSKSKVIDFLFSGCENLSEIDLSNLSFDCLESCRHLVDGCSNLQKINLSNTSLRGDVDMSYMFANAAALAEVDLDGFFATHPLDMNHMFSGCSSLESIDLTGFDASKCTSFGQLFYNCSNLAHADVSTLNTSSVECMRSAFLGCATLESVSIANWDFSSVNDMAFMFSGCSSLDSIQFPSFGDFSSLKSMACMFEDCSSLHSLDLSMLGSATLEWKGGTGFFDYSIKGAFKGCSALEELNLGSIDTSLVTSMTDLFKDCLSLRKLDLSGFNTRNVTDMEAMFEGCDSLCEVRLGSNFGFGDEESGNYLCTLPEYPDGYGSMSKWKNVDTGTAYDADEIPSYVDAVYIAAFPLRPEQFIVDTSPAVYTGQYIEPEVRAGDLVEGVDYEIEYWNNLNAGVGQVHIKGLGSYLDVGEDWYFKIEKAEPTFVVPVGLGAQYGDTLGSVALPDGFSWQDELGTSVGELGIHQFLARFTPAESRNYKSVENIPVEVNVRKRVVCVPDGESLDFSRGALCGVPESDEYSVSGIGYIPGDYTSTLSLNDKIHCVWDTTHASDDVQVSWKINSTEDYVPDCVMKVGDNPLMFQGPDEPSHDVNSCDWILSNPNIGSLSNKTVLPSKMRDWSIPAITFTPEQAGDTMLIVDGQVSHKSWIIRVEPDDRTDLRLVSVVGIDDEYVYTGAAIEPNPVLEIGGARLAVGEDYDIAIDDNVQVGTATMVITGKGDYKGTLELAFDIIPANINIAILTPIPDQVATGDPIEPSIDVSVEGRPLVEEEDFEVYYENNVAVGTATVHVVGKGNYSGERQVTFNIIEEGGGGHDDQPQDPESKYSFSDVTPGVTDHAVHIQWLADEGISRGWDNGDGTFRYEPYLDVARADMAAFLYRLAGSPAFEPSEADMAAFSDVDASTPHYEEVLWLASAGISEGWGNGDGTREFRPYASIARIDMAAFLHRLADWMGAPEPEGPGIAFPDVPASMDHSEDVAWLAAAGITTGFPDGTFKPYDTIVRCDMAAMLHRLDGCVEGYEVA